MDIYNIQIFVKKYVVQMIMPVTNIWTRNISLHGNESTNDETVLQK